MKKIEEMNESEFLEYLIEIVPEANCEFVRERIDYLKQDDVPSTISVPKDCGIEACGFYVLQSGKTYWCEACKKRNAQDTQDAPKGCGKKEIYRVSGKWLSCGEKYKEELPRYCNDCINQDKKGCGKHVQVGYNKKLDCPINNQCGITKLYGKVFLCAECKDADKSVTEGKDD